MWGWLRTVVGNRFAGARLCVVGQGELGCSHRVKKLLSSATRRQECGLRRRSCRSGVRRMNRRCYDGTQLLCHRGCRQGRPTRCERGCVSTKGRGDDGDWESFRRSIVPLLISGATSSTIILVGVPVAASERRSGKNNCRCRRESRVRLISRLGGLCLICGRRVGASCMH